MSVSVTIDLKAKLPLQDSGPYTITVTNVDTCEHTSSVTVTIGTYNAVSTLLSILTCTCTLASTTIWKLIMPWVLHVLHIQCILTCTCKL